MPAEISALLLAGFVVCGCAVGMPAAVFHPNSVRKTCIGRCSGASRSTGSSDSFLLTPPASRRPAATVTAFTIGCSLGEAKLAIP
ncbi:hypothetical protein WJX75_000540 [Coccomyxa subellipsoidea]|uniref:Secreted protein n=1 Tax=Coccomyxa subellipsoidea TaxID=248742 RepID=A0ABR2YB34_9CHLO